MNRKPYPIDDCDYFWDDDRDRGQIHRPDAEWLAEHPQEIGRIFTGKISELRHEAQSLRQALTKKLRVIAETETDEFTGWFAKEWLRATDASKIAELESKISHFERLLNISSGNLSNWDLQVEAARKNPILDIVGSDCQLRRTGKTYVSKCPLHEERTPSFHLYAGQGTFHCFGCGAHGDVITYMMLRNQLSFKEAVWMLSGGYHE